MYGLETKGRMDIAAWSAGQSATNTPIRILCANSPCTKDPFSPSLPRTLTMSAPGTDTATFEVKEKIAFVQLDKFPVNSLGTGEHALLFQPSNIYSILFYKASPTA